jgi:protease IV
MPNAATDIQPEQNTVNAPLNRDIEMFLSTCEMLEIDFDFGLTQLNAYLQDLMFLQAGGKYKDLAIAQRRSESRPRIITTTDAATPASINFVNRLDINDPETIIPPNSVALLKLTGVMRSQSGISSPGVDSMANDLRSAYANPNVAGVVIETNSGGGETLAGNMLKSAIAERNKPVVGFGHLVASAAFRALTGADEIVMSSEFSEVGSIGTMVQLDTRALSKFRNHVAEFYGSDAPNKNGELRRALAGDYSGIQQRVNELTVQFHNEIKRDRPLRGDVDKIKDTLSGKMFDAVEGKRRGLVDAVGTLPFAVKRVFSLKSKY